MQPASLQLPSPGAGSRSSDLPLQPVPGSCRHNFATAHCKPQATPLPCGFSQAAAFFFIHLSPVSRTGEGSWELPAAAALAQGMPSTAPASGDLPCQSNVPPRPACEVRGLMSEYLWCAKQPIFPYIHSQKQMSNFFA